MATGIFAIQENGQLLEMNEAAYASEDILQELLEKYPDLLAGDQIDSTSPRRWLLVQREMAVPDIENGAGRWSVDHLFLDQDAIPTLVEVKRSSDTRIRREVVGQMMDYAANAVSYWPAEYIQDCYKTTCEAQGLDAEQQLIDLLDDDSGDLDVYWHQLKTNLQVGKVRMIFVADQIPTELKRIVEFLNEQMSPAEVLAVEIKQYSGQGLKTLVPKVIGQTAQAQITKKTGTRSEQRQWTEESFLVELEQKSGATALATVKKILSWAKQHQLEIAWGKGAKWGAFRLFVVCGGQKYRLFRAWSADSLEVYFKFLREHSLFEDAENFAVLLNKLYNVPGIEPTKLEWRDTFLRVAYAQLDDVTLPAFLEVYDWIIEQLQLLDNAA